MAVQALTCMCRTLSEIPTCNAALIQCNQLNVHFPGKNIYSHYDVLLSAYMRSGSTLTGQILGYHSDSFYVFEPLMIIAPWIYWMGTDTVCRSDREECR